MSISIPRGGNQPIKIRDAHDRKTVIGLNWSTLCSDNSFDIDASAFLLDEQGKVRSGADFIFYNQPCHALNPFICLDENLIPGKPLIGIPNEEADRQSFSLDLNEVPPTVHRIVFCLTIHEAEQRGQNFGMTDWLKVRLMDQSVGEDMMHFQTSKEFSTETAIQLGEVYRRGAEWKFRAVAQGYAGGLSSLAKSFGVDLELAEASDPSTKLDPIAFTVSLDQDAQESLQIEPNEASIFLSKRKRRSSGDIITAIAEEIRARLKSILPQVNVALQNCANESSSRLILDRILQHVLGYSIEEIKAEQKIQGRSADYVLAPGGSDTVVIEAKRIGAPLKEKQIFQATSYAAYAGIKWALLTNITVWQLYKVSTTDKIEPHLVFTIDLRKGLTDDAVFYFALISRSGIIRKTPLDRLWLTRRALSPESLITAILHDDVLLRIRNVVARENG